MYTIQGHVRIVIPMAKYESVTAVKRKLEREGFQHKPTDKTIRFLYERFSETGSVEDEVRLGRPNSSVNPEFGLPDRTLSLTEPVPKNFLYKI